ncbi:MAG: hypothetical protein KF705_10250 [Phycisphaeraceae bacterium]|nr:hypothetical protein [Phycisphaeraceae bacterium]
MAPEQPVPEHWFRLAGLGGNQWHPNILWHRNNLWLEHWFRLAGLGGNQWHPNILWHPSNVWHPNRAGERECGVVDGEDAGEAVEVMAGAACALGSAEFEALGLQ